MIANVTAIKDGELLENGNDVSATALMSLLDPVLGVDQIVIHEVHEQDVLDDVKGRYEDEWDDVVVMSDDDEDESQDDGQECLHTRCDATATMVAECEQGQTKHYCDEHAGGRRAGHALVEQWREL